MASIVTKNAYVGVQHNLEWSGNAVGNVLAFNFTMWRIKSVVWMGRRQQLEHVTYETTKHIYVCTIL